MIEKPWKPRMPEAREADGLLTARAEPVLSRLRGLTEDDTYLYQQPVEERLGPRVLLSGKSFLMLSSYDYLGLIGDPRIEGAAIEATRRHGTASGGVRLLGGTTSLHHELDRELARFKGTELALSFTSGYLANLAALSPLFGPRDLVLADAHIHRSLIEACAIARVPLRRFAHNDVRSLARQLERHRDRRTLIVVEGVYSMDGDLCPLGEIVELKRRFGAYLMVDESHSFGVLGRSGRGIDEHFGLEADAADLWMGSLSKAVPSNGGFLAGRRELMVYLQHAAPPYVFSAAASPASVAAAIEAIRIVATEPWRREKLDANAEKLRAGLRASGYDVGTSESAIVPVILGEDRAAHELARTLYDRGVLATAVVQPAVGRQRARLRLCATAAHSEEDLDEALEALSSLVSAAKR